MTGYAAVGVLGAAGTVGRVAVVRLAAAGIGPLRLGGRDVHRLRSLGAGTVGAPTTTFPLDLADSARLARFCGGCDLVLNCAGPSYQVLDTVARAALNAGAHYVDPAGDLPAREALRADPPAVPSPRTAVFSAGLIPGLTGLLPRVLVDGVAPARLDIYIGGAGTISETSAVDVLIGRGPSFGTPFAAWRDGQVVARALSPLRGVSLPGFDHRADAWPILTVEAMNLARQLGVGELRHYGVYFSDAIPRAIAQAWAGDADPTDHTAATSAAATSAATTSPAAGSAAAAICAAAASDVATYGQRYTLLAQTRPRADRRANRARRLTLRTTDPYGLSGVVSAYAVREVLSGRMPVGCHLAADVLDARSVLRNLSEDPIVTSLELQ